MRPPRSLAALAALAVLSLSTLAACGGSDDPDGSGGSGSGTGGTSSSGDPAPPPDTDAETADDGGTGGTGGSGPSAAAFMDCSAISADEMAAVLGEGAGTAEVPPGGGGCDYGLDDPNQPSVFLEAFGTSDFADGFEGAKANISNTAVGPIEDSTETDVADVGDGAKVAVGLSVGGTSLQSIGLVLLGDTIVRASVLQGIDLDQEAMLQLTTDVLTLVASKG